MEAPRLEVEPLTACACHGISQLAPGYHLGQVQTYLLNGVNEETRTRCHEGLLWLRANIRRIDCPRFLLRVRDVLCGRDAAFATTSDLFWDTYGVLLCHLLLYDDDTLRRVRSEEIWGELADRFRKSVRWQDRAGQIACFSRVARHCAHVLKVSNGKHFTPFCQALDCFAVYFLTTAGLLLPPTPYYRLALGHYCDLWYQLVLYLSDDPAVIGHDVRIQCLLVRTGHLLLRLIAQVGLLGTEELDKWHDAMSLLADQLSRPHREDVQRLLDSIARDLDSHACLETRPKVSARLSDFCRNLMPKLHQPEGPPYDYNRPDRRLIAPGDSRCEVVLSGDATIERAAYIEDVCARHASGFCIVLPHVATDDRYEKTVGLSGEKIGKAECRCVRLFEGASGQHFRNVELRIRYRENMLSITLECKILRAWPLSEGSGVGMAVLATPEALGKARPEYDAWKDYVARLPVKAPKKPRLPLL